MKKDLTRYAIIDLHLHLDGSLSPEAIIAIAKHEALLLPTYRPEKLRKYLEVSPECPSLAAYLTKFDLPNAVLQTRYGLTTATLDLLRRLSEQGLRYVEIRMAPQLSLRRGLCQKEVVQTLIDAMKEGERRWPIRANLILCLMRGAPKEVNDETIRVAHEFLGHGVVAVDLAGAEALHPNSEHLDHFACLHELDIPFTVHAGEALGAESVAMVLPYEPDRIGHGVHALKDKDVLRKIIRRKIPLEICPKSNLDTKAISSYQELKIRKMLKKGVRLTINTDDMSVSSTTLKKEYQTLVDLGLKEKDILKIVRNAIDAAFLAPQEKRGLLAYLKKLRRA